MIIARHSQMVQMAQMLQKTDDLCRCYSAWVDGILIVSAQTILALCGTGVIGFTQGSFHQLQVF